jgi:20S proteasome alpha/beta subunit
VTVLVGVRCRDGVVIGSDSAATSSGGGPGIIEQPTRKIDIVDNALILAGTGALGLGQRFCAQLETLHRASGEKTYRERAPVEVGKMMAAHAVNDFASTGAKAGGYGALVAFKSRKEFHLCEFGSADMQPELKTDIWYASMGSGQAIADPFLALMRRVFWSQGLPTLADGIFAAVWTLLHTIEVNPGGINGPARIAVLTWDPDKVGEKSVARMLTDEELDEHKQSVADAEKHLAGFRDVVGGEVGDAPDVPTPALA